VACSFASACPRDMEIKAALPCSIAWWTARCRNGIAAEPLWASGIIRLFVQLRSAVKGSFPSMRFIDQTWWDNGRNVPNVSRILVDRFQLALEFAEPRVGCP
jgi:hypothetical protein